jgi:hypothetical protein
MVLDSFRVDKRKSRRWGTREGIEALKDFAEIIEDTAAENDASAVDFLGSPNSTSIRALDSPALAMCRRICRAPSGRFR